MDKPPYSTIGREIIAETPDLRVALMTLAPGQATPWHHHSEIADTAFGLTGAARVEVRGGPNELGEEKIELRELMPGARVRVGPRRVHRVVNAGAGRCSYLLVQGVGKYDFLEAGQNPG